MGYITRKINGQTFRKLRAFDLKKDANSQAEKMRKRGMNVRIIQLMDNIGMTKSKKKRYFVFFRNK